jgi:predicted DNA-binding transcriptional regulator YafY
METVSPTARALLALEVLQDNPGVSAERLAGRLGVTDRAVRRYVGLLREAGIPIESSTGRYGGYRLGRGTRLPPLILSAAEAIGLVMAVLEGRPGAADTADPVGSAIGKITRLLPKSLAESVAAMRHVITAQTGLVSAAPDPEVTATLVRASEARRRVRVSYQLRQEREMEVDPWAVSVWRGRWYLLGWSHTKDARRVLRVDRVTSAVVLDEAFVLPDELDPIATIEEHMSTGWRYHVEVVIDAPKDAVARWLPRSLGRLEPTDAERTRLVGTTDEPLWYARHLTALEAPYRIVSPLELRAASRDLAQRLMDAASDDHG